MKFLKAIFTGLAIFTLTALASGQPAHGAPEPGQAPTPFGFTEILIAAGAALGGKKAYDMRKKKDLP